MPNPLMSRASLSHEKLIRTAASCYCHQLPDYMLLKYDIITLEIHDIILDIVTFDI